MAPFSQELEPPTKPGRFTTRFYKHDANVLASVKLAAIRIWMRL